MNKYLINKNNLKVNKITYKSNSIVIDTPLGLFLIKEENIKTYDYLLSRGFNYFPNIIDYDSEGVIFEYIDNIDYDINLKSKDFIKLLSLLHVKTSCFLDKNDYEMIFDSLNTCLGEQNVLESCNFRFHVLQQFLHSVQINWFL